MLVRKNRAFAVIEGTKLGPFFGSRKFLLSGESRARHSQLETCVVRKMNMNWSLERQSARVCGPNAKMVAREGFGAGGML